MPGGTYSYSLARFVLDGSGWMPGESRVAAIGPDDRLAVVAAQGGDDFDRKKNTNGGRLSRTNGHRRGRTCQ